MVDEPTKNFIAQATVYTGIMYIAANITRGIIDEYAEAQYLGEDGRVGRVVANNVARVSGNILIGLLVIGWFSAP
jgi:hypothetical protein